MREIQPDWYDHFWRKANEGAAFSEDQPACKGMSSLRPLEMLLDFVAQFHFAKETRIFVNNVLTVG